MGRARGRNLRGCFTEGKKSQKDVRVRKVRVRFPSKKGEGIISWEKLGLLAKRGRHQRE